MGMVLTDNVHSLFAELQGLYRPFRKRKEKNQLFSLFVFTESIFIPCDLIESWCLWLLFPVHQAVALFHNAAIFIPFQVGT